MAVEERPPSTLAASAADDSLPDRGVEKGILYVVRFIYTSEIAQCTYGTALSAGARVIAVSRYGKDIAMVLGRAKAGQGTASEIVRVASAMDLQEYESIKDREARALQLCREKVDVRGLPMKLLSAHLLPEENKVLFFFSAEGRVDFRELVKDLVAAFRLRIELRQVGVRDESRILGGMGVCGRVLCCHALPDQSCSVSIKMAKEQNLSLGSMKASGPCGRLMCCLAYEYEYYSCERCRFPQRGTEIAGGIESYVVSDINLISHHVIISGGGGGVLSLPLDRFHRDPARGHWSVNLQEGEDCEDDTRT